MTKFDVIQKVLYRSLDKEKAINKSGSPAIIKGSKNNKLSFIGIFVKNYKPGFEYNFIDELVDMGALPAIDDLSKLETVNLFIRLQTIHSINKPEDWDISLAALAANYGEMN